MERKKLFFISGLFWIVLFLINYGHGAGWSGVYSILIKQIGTDALSYFFLFSAIGGFILNIVLMFFSDLLSNEKLVQGSFACFICILAVNLSVLEMQGAFGVGSYKALLIFLAVLTIAVPSVFIIQTWNLINKTFSPKSATNIYPILATAPLIGSILGGFTAHRITSFFPTKILLVMWAVCIFIAMITTFVLNRKIKGNVQEPVLRVTKKELVENFSEGITHFKKSSFALDLSIVFMSFWLVTTLIDFCYAKTLDKTFPTSEEMASFYGGYTSIASITALIIQTFLGSKMLKKTGVRKGFLFLPLSQIFGFILIIFSPGLAPIVITMFMQTLIGMSIQSNSVQVSFNIFASHVRGKIRTLLEGVINPLGGVIGALTIIVINMIQKDATFGIEKILPFFGIVFSSIWLYAAIRIKKSYLKEISFTHTEGNARDKNDAREALEIERKAL